MESRDEEDKISICSQVNVQVKVTKNRYSILLLHFPKIRMNCCIYFWIWKDYFKQWCVFGDERKISLIFPQTSVRESGYYRYLIIHFHHLIIHFHYHHRLNIYISQLKYDKKLFV